MFHPSIFLRFLPLKNGQEEAKAAAVQREQEAAEAAQRAAEAAQAAVEELVPWIR